MREIADPMFNLRHIAQRRKFTVSGVLNCNIYNPLIPNDLSSTPRRDRSEPRHVLERLRRRSRSFFAMSESRKTSRHRILKAGTIAFNRAGGISCIVRNISAAGACLEVASPFGIPDDFTLVIDNDHLQRSCHIAWRRDNRIGITFN